MRNIIPLSEPAHDQLTATGETTFKYPVIPVQSTPHIAPLLMWPDYFCEDEQEFDDDGIPIWDGYHPEYPYENKWFSNDYGPVGRRLRVRKSKHKVEIISITAEPFNGVWCWLIGLKVVGAVHA